MNTLSRFFDSLTTVFFILWMFLNMFEKFSLSVVCIAGVVFFGGCLLLIRAFVFFSITLHRLKQQ